MNEDKDLPKAKTPEAFDPKWLTGWGSVIGGGILGMLMYALGKGLFVEKETSTMNALEKAFGGLLTAMFDRIVDLEKEIEGVNAAFDAMKKARDDKHHTLLEAQGQCRDLATSLEGAERELVAVKKELSDLRATGSPPAQAAP